MSKKTPVSKETSAEALKVAKGTARPGQTKEQTKIIAQGIEKGIAEYKKREKAKARERDKERKKAQRVVDTEEAPVTLPAENSRSWLPWALLLISWAGFICFQLFLA